MVERMSWVWLLALCFAVNPSWSQDETKEEGGEQPAAEERQADESNDRGRDEGRDRDRGRGGDRDRGRGRGGPGFSPSAMMIGLALNDEVVRALELGDEQQKYLELLRDEMREEDREFFESMGDDVPREERFAKFRDYQSKRGPEVERHMKEILGEEKLGRLKQIRLQAFGAFAMMSPETAKEVEITESQQEEIRNVMRSTFTTFRERFRDGFDRDSARETMEEIRKEIDGKILAVLTDRQKERWQKLVGEPVQGVDLDKIRDSMRPRGGGDRGPSRGRDGNRGRRETNRPQT